MHTYLYIRICHCPFSILMSFPLTRSLIDHLCSAYARILNEERQYLVHIYLYVHMYGIQSLKVLCTANEFCFDECCVNGMPFRNSMQSLLFSAFCDLKMLISRQQVVGGERSTIKTQKSYNNTGVNGQHFSTTERRPTVAAVGVGVINC